MPGQGKTGVPREGKLLKETEMVLRSSSLTFPYQLSDL